METTSQQSQETTKEEDHNIPKVRRISSQSDSDSSRSSSTVTPTGPSPLVRNYSLRGKIDKSAYRQLHRQISSSSGSSVDKLKGKYENISVKPTVARVCTSTDNASTNDKENRRNEAEKTNNGGDENAKQDDTKVYLRKTESNIENLQNRLSNRLSTETIEKLRSRYSPASFGYSSKTKNVAPTPPTDNVSKIPVPAPRTSLKSPLPEKETGTAKIETVKIKLVSIPGSPDKPRLRNSSIPATSPKKDENSNVLRKVSSPVLRERPSSTSATLSNFQPVHPINKLSDSELRELYGEIEFAEPEDKHFIVRRSSSEDSVDQFESFFSEIVMEKPPKEKKRSNSFRKLAAGIFSRDKKKTAVDKRQHKRDIGVFSENAQNESQAFDRSSSHRHTVDSSFGKHDGYRHNAYRSQPTDNSNSRGRYTEMSGNGVQSTFSSNRPQTYTAEDYVPMDNFGVQQPNRNVQNPYINFEKYGDTSSSSCNTLDSDNRNCTYQNSLIAQAEMRQQRNHDNRRVNNGIINKETNDFDRRNDRRNVQLVKPKAFIPINSERPLPNPYHNSTPEKPQNSENSKTIDRNLNVEHSKPAPSKNYLNVNGNVENQLNRGVIVEDVYGTVFDNIAPASPTSPRSLESSKLKLPVNRDKVELQPRLRSPIPQVKVSTDKIIATSLLRTKKSPSPRDSPSLFDESSSFSTRSSPQMRATSSPIARQHVRERSLDRTNRSEEMQAKMTNLSLKSENTQSLSDSLQAGEWHRQQRELENALPVDNSFTTNVLVHANPEGGHVRVGSRSSSPMLREQIYYHQQRPPYYNSLEKPPSVRSSNTSLTRAHTPTHQQQPPIEQSQSPRSPEKQQIINNVEAFYWRQLKKLKNQEDQELAMYRQQQYEMYGYVEEPVVRRRSRSESPGGMRGAQRSLSLPREDRTNLRLVRPIISRDGIYSGKRIMNGHEAIPEGRPVIAKQPIILPVDPTYEETNRSPYFVRNAFERSTIGPIGSRMVQVSSDGSRQQQLYPPIFKRGSLTGSISVPDSQLSKRVSFSNSINPNDPKSWPTKNGFTKSPPTRRVERDASTTDDEVFLPNSPNREDPYGRIQHQKQITVNNKVCDIYGKIHDQSELNQRLSTASQNYGAVKQVGTVYGQLLQGHERRPPPVVLRQSYNQLSSPGSNFVRGTRLTASANDMYRRYQLEDAYHHQRQTNERIPEAPNRPLPPIPPQKLGATRNPHMVLYPQGPRRQQNVIEEEWNSDGKLGRGSGSESGGNRGDDGEVKTGRGRSARRDDPRRHTLSGDQHYGGMAGQGGPLSRTMDLEGQFARGYPPSSNAMLFDDDPGIMSEVETSSTGFRRGGKQRSSLPVVRTPSKTLERPLGLVFLQYRNETKRALLPNEITSIDTVKALFVRSFPKQLSMEYLDSPLVKIYIHDSSKDMFYELEDVRSHLREIRDRSVLRLFESTDVSGGLPMVGVGIPGGVGHFEDPSYFSEPEFDSEYQHQHIHKSKGNASKGAPYYMGSTSSLPRGGPLLRPYSPAVGNLPPDRLKTLPGGAPPKPQRAYSSGAATRAANDGSSLPPDRFAPFQRPTNPVFNLPDGYMSSPERGSRGYEDPYYSQYTSRSGSITPVIDEEISDTELLDEQYSLYGVKMAPGAGPRNIRAQFPGPTAPPYDTTRLRVEHMERQLANLTGLVQKALTQTPPQRDFLAPPGRESYRSGDEFDKNSSSSSTSLPDKSVSFEKSVSFSDEPPDMNSPKQHSPQHTADTKPPKPAIKSSTLPRTSSQEKDRLKPAPPPKPASLSPGQYEGRHIYRDLQLTPEMYNQLRGLQKKAKDLRAEVRNLRRMSQAQAHSVRETIRDAFIKIRAMLVAGGEQVWQAGMDQERVRLSRDEDLYKQEMLRLEKDLTELEGSVEELRGNVINRKTRVNMSDVENMALILSKSSKTVADLKLRFPGLQDSMKAFLSSEMDKVVREEKFLKEEPERLESALRRCKKLTGTLVTLKRLASVQEQRLPCATGTPDGRISPTISETPPVTPTTGQHSKPSSGARVGQVSFGGDATDCSSDGSQRPENALDALLDELQTFSKPHHPATVSTQMPQQQAPSSSAPGATSDSTPSSDPPAIPVKGIPPSHSAHFGHPHVADIGRKGSVDSASILPTQNLMVSTATGSLRRLHSYPSGSDTDNSPPIQPPRGQLADGKGYSKPPIPERNAELLQHINAVRRVPPPPPPRTSSKSPLASPTSPSLPPRSPATGLQHIQNVQNISAEKQPSQFELATQNLGLSTLRRNVPSRSSLKDSTVNNKSQTLPRNIGSNLQVHTHQVVPTSATASTCIGGELQNVSSSSCESVNSQDGTRKGSRKEELEQRHQELLKKQKALQEQYARLQQLQRGNNQLVAVVPPAPDQLLKKTGSESNLLQKMGLQLTTAPMTGSLTNLPGTAAVSAATQQPTATDTTDNVTTTTSKVYETDIL